MTFLDTDFLQSDEIRLKLTKTADEDKLHNIAPTYYFDIIRRSDGAAVGQCNLRIGHAEQLYFAGNIGYVINAEYRGKHYAAKACRLLFMLARLHDMEYVIITCRPDNTASKRTIELAGGRLVTVAELPNGSEMRLRGTHICVWRVEL